MDKIEVRPAKSVKDITDKLLSKVFKEHDVFFAFNKEQIEEGKKEGVKYIANKSLNMFYNIEKKDTIYLEMDNAIEEAQRIDKELHTKEQIILRELINYECFYICDFTDVVEPLEAYGYTVKDIQPIFIKYLQKYSE